MRLFQRQKLLLAFVEAAGGEIAATDLQKLLFLYAKNWEEEASFKFVPYRYGCFSFQSYADRNTLIKKGLLLSREDKYWEITNLAKPYLDKALVYRARLFLEKAVPERGKSLIKRVYKEAPFYACRSEIVDEVLTEKADLRAVQDAGCQSKEKALFTIGYEADSIDGYLSRLVQNNVHLLCDVRRNPLSRKTGFSKNQLSSYCSKIGIDYLHMPELGIPSHRRRELVTQKDYDSLFAEYVAEDLPQQKEAIQTLLELLEKYQRIALTCFELEPHCCHRHCVSDAMEVYPNCPSAQHI